MLALVLGDIGAEHSPSAFMMQQADVRVCLPVSSRFTDGRSLPLPGAVALALQALLQKYPSYAPTSLFPVLLPLRSGTESIERAVCVVDNEDGLTGSFCQSAGSCFLFGVTLTRRLTRNMVVKRGYGYICGFTTPNHVHGGW